MSVTITTTRALNNLKFGIGSICNNQTFKLRFSEDLANLILVNMPKHFHKHICVAYTSRTLKSGKVANYTYIAVCEHQSSAIWYALNLAIRKGKATSLRITADIIENPYQYPVYHMEFDDMPFH